MDNASGRPVLTLEDYCERIPRLRIEALEREQGQSVAEMIAEYDRALEPHRTVMSWARKAALGVMRSPHEPNPTESKS